MTFGPAQVHPQEHLRPVRCLGAARTGADRHKGGALIVFARKQERGPLSLVGLGEGVPVALDFGVELRIVRVLEELEQLDQVGCALVEVRPEIDLGAEAVGLAEDPLGASLIIPEARSLGQRLEFGEAGLFGRKVKDAPMSTGCAQPGLGWRRLPT
jgi:hypothetical protein